MTISFNSVPRTRVPGFYPEFVSADNTSNKGNKTLIIGQAVGVVSQTPVLITNPDQARGAFGYGSIAARMVEAYYKNDDSAELWVLPLNDGGSSTAATFTITLTGTGTAAGTHHLYVAGVYVPIGVLASDTTPTLQAAKIAAAITAMPDLPVTAAAVAGVVTLTAKNKGTLGNQIDVRVNHLSDIAGQVTPAGITVVIAAGVTGATDPTLATILSVALGDTPFDNFVNSLNDVTNINAMKAFVDARWSPTVRLFGLHFEAKQDSVANLVTLGSTVSFNDGRQVLVGYTGSPTFAPEAAAMVAAQAANSLAIDPARQLKTLPLVGFVLPKGGLQHTYTERVSLLNNGIATIVYNSGVARIDRAITTYLKNAQGVVDESYLDIMTSASLVEIERTFEDGAQLYARSKLAADGSTFGDGQDIVTPKTVKADFASIYETLVERGICQDQATFERRLIVEIDTQDPNRLNVMLPVTLVGNLMVLAVQVRFSRFAA